MNRKQRRLNASKNTAKPKTYVSDGSVAFLSFATSSNGAQTVKLTLSSALVRRDVTPLWVTLAEGERPDSDGSISVGVFLRPAIPGRQKADLGYRRLNYDSRSGTWGASWNAELIRARCSVLTATSKFDNTGFHLFSPTAAFPIAARIDETGAEMVAIARVDPQIAPPPIPTPATVPPPIPTPATVPPVPAPAPNETALDAITIRTALGEESYRGVPSAVVAAIIRMMDYYVVKS